ncbi:MAG: hypothetical protein KatS3mg090_0109 [Patescibacteria group bacterium]|nr:MAG: hypothetical protein KatS3mg090_0109 [Patescibacteria group bacterium]
MKDLNTIYKTIYEFGDLKILRLNQEDLDKVNKKMLLEFPVIQIYGKTPYGIYHSENVSFNQRVNFQKDAFEHIRSKKERKALLKNYKYIESMGIKISVKRANLEDYRKFEELYNQTIVLKQRFKNISLKEQVLSKIDGGLDVFFINATQKDELLSSLAFYIRKTSGKKKVYITVRANKEIKELRSGLVGILEVELLKFCIQKKISEISHGISFNPTGLLAPTGIWEFKTRYGNSPFPAGMFLSTYIKSRQISLSKDILFLTIGNNDLEYTIVCDDNKRNEYKSRYLTKYVNKVRFISWQKVEDDYKRFLQNIND